MFKPKRKEETIKKVTNVTITIPRDIYNEFNEMMVENNLSGTNLVLQMLRPCVDDWRKQKGE